MKNSNDAVLTKNEKIHVEALTKIATQQHENARNFNNQKGIDAPNGYVWANITFGFSGGPAGGSCTGYINYDDNRRLRYYGEATLVDGYPFAMAPLPNLRVLVLPYEVLQNADAKYFGEGFGNFGLMHLTCGGRLVSPSSWAVAGGGFWYWKTEGKGKFTTA